MSGAILSGVCWIILVMVWMAIAVKALEWREKYLYWKASYKKLSAAFMEKEKKITFLKGEVKAFAWATGLMQELETMEKLISELSEEEQTPEWYKAALLDKIGDNKNLEMLNTLLEDANSIYAEEVKTLEGERDMLAKKIETIREEYKKYLLEKGLKMPDVMPLFGQTGVPEEMKPNDEPVSFETAAQHHPADELQDVVSGC